MWKTIKGLFWWLGYVFTGKDGPRQTDYVDLEWINHLPSGEIVEIYGRHVEQVNGVWAEDRTGLRTLGEAVKIWLRRKMTADPTYDWVKDPGEPMPEPFEDVTTFKARPLTPESRLSD